MASPFQLAGGRRRLEHDLALSIRRYVEGIGQLARDMKIWEEFGRIGKPPDPPEVPAYLELYFELMRWPGHLLVAGGLYDQPSWTWEMIDLAGHIYGDLMDEQRRVKELMDGVHTP